MIKDNILYHNVDEIEETRFGYRLNRYTKEVSAKVNDGAKNMNRYACGCELRFVTEAKSIKITIYSENDYGDVLVYKGDNMHSSYRINQIGFMTFTLNDFEPFLNVNDKFFDGRRFSKEVWRIYFHGFICTVSEIDTLGYAVRPPKLSEMPRKTMLSYGSSISHGASTMVHSNSYPQTFARLAGVDCLIKGTGGSCFAEKAVADYFAAREDWDIALLELGINMANNRFTEKDFEERFDYFTDTMAKTGRRLIFLTIFPCSLKFTECDDTYKMYAYNTIIRNKYKDMDKEKCILVEGNEVLNDTGYLMCDCIHPSTEGHMMMGVNLYNILKNWL